MPRGRQRSSHAESPRCCLLEIATGIDSAQRSIVSYNTQLHHYIIAYAPDEKPIVVLAVLHGRRSPRVGLTQLNATLP